ncbi:MAG: orotidine-5'-phosphate decarboxylase [Candidatus Aminicenantes bacterium]|nr:orotidine-5'-phosphate decarboxylase [Candidatus Aminicenantes bacterium]
MKKENRIFVALDVDETRFKELSFSLQSATHFKVGFPLFLKIGRKGLDTLKKKGKKLFLDFKFFDIPNTMIESAKSMIDLGADFFTVHLLAGKDHLKKVMEAVREKAGTRVKVLGVTVLTSLIDDDLKDTGIKRSLEDQVLKLAELGLAAGIDGVVSSARELSLLHPRFEDALIYVTPGIRPFWNQKDDQKRVLGFHEALKAGATYTVIGRPITRAENPEAAFKRILKEG